MRDGSIPERKREAIARHSEQAELFAARYGGPAEDPYRDCFAYSRRRLEDALVEFLPNEGHGLWSLDLGCGTGHQMADLARRGFVAIGVDGSRAMLSHARDSQPHAALGQADAETLPFPSERFDVVLSVEVLRYLPRLHPTLSEIARVLKPGGLCLATAAPMLSLNGYALVNQITRRVALGNMTRLRQSFVTSWGLRRAFAKAGFQPIDVRGVYLGPLNWIERLAPKALPAALRAWEPLDARLADLPVLRELSNMFLVAARRR